MSEEPKSGFIKAATNEYSLFLYRAVTGLCAIIITGFVIGTRDDVRAISKDLGDFKLAYEGRISKLEGQVGQLDGSVKAHRERIAGNDNDIRSIWSRIYDLTARNGSPQRSAP